MSRTAKNSRVIEACGSESLFDKFKKNNQTLDEIQKSLEDYLETKRASFARFYFLSNDELIEILSQTRNPQAVQPHLHKCFDAIHFIKFTEANNSNEMVSMTSAEHEVVEFSESVFSTGNVEHWLGRIEDMMIKTLFDITKKGLEEYPEDGLERDEWFFNYPAQPVLVISQVKWTEGCAEAI